jgi:hypothetical protein
MINGQKCWLRAASLMRRASRKIAKNFQKLAVEAMSYAEGFEPTHLPSGFRLPSHNGLCFPRFQRNRLFIQFVGPREDGANTA